MQSCPTPFNVIRTQQTEEHMQLTFAQIVQMMRLSEMYDEAHITIHDHTSDTVSVSCIGMNVTQIDSEGEFVWMVTDAERHAIEMVMGNVARVYGFEPTIHGIARDSQSPTTFIIKHDDDDDGGTCKTIVHAEEWTI